MKYKILLVEDDEFKRKKIQDFLLNESWCGELSTAVSVSGAIRELDDNIFDILLLDMAIPNHDDGADGAQGLGGLAVFRYLQIISKKTNVIVVTQFEALNEGSTVVDIGTLQNLLVNEFNSQFLGLIQYLTDTDTWKERVTKMINIKG
ncbi:response regulator [Janthinobacterium sp. EB271-G4-7A]|uniref:response regulator n=1 Tax=Janthinobacterium sp. EB271-G4-7A TaxID=2775056 RepID=UPI001E450B20|nr:response regulator [Janthinobacterium sp. EB271-G4-7A]MCC7697625.1 response regulator [Janthinobacterium sp. EB271-G4-7A]